MTAVSVAKLAYLYSSTVSLAVIQYLYSCFIIYHHSQPFSTHRKRKMIFNTIKQENYNFPVPTEYATEEKLLLLSSIPSIPFSSSCLSTFSSSSTLSGSCSFCFPFSLLPYTFISSPLDSSHDNSSSSES